MISARTLVISGLFFSVPLGGGCSSISGTGTDPGNNTDMQSTDMAGAPVPAGSPVLSAVTPGVGPSGGGILLNITGQNFKDGATVSIDGQDASPVSVLSETQLSALLPVRAGGFGLVPVSVQNPSGLKASRSDLFAYYSSSVKFVAQPLLTINRGPQQTSFGDFNGDQNLDMVVPDSATDDISVLLGDGKGGFGTPTTYPTGHGAKGSAIGDLNGDGKLDIAIANYFTDQVSVYLGDGAGRFSTATTFSVTNSPWSLSLVDFNGDKKLDIAVAGSGVAVLLGDGKGKFGAPKYLNQGTNCVYTAVADFNGDGKVDIAAPATSSYSFNVLLGDGLGGFATPKTYYVSNYPGGVVTADFNGDGKLDLAFATEYDLSVVLGAGDGTFGQETIFKTGVSYRNSNGPLVVADFNGDRQLDLVLTSVSSDTTIMYGDGKGKFGTHDAVGFIYANTSISAADLNKDRRPDLIISDQSRNYVGVLLNQSQ